LELSLNEPFVLARGGDQPSGDAHSAGRDLCVQAKRYTEGSPPAKNIEGDFDQSLRALPNTDVYVLAVTRDTAQLDDTLDGMRGKSAVDVVVWDFEGEGSALPILCLEYWDKLQAFQAISDIHADLTHWVSSCRGAASHGEKLREIVYAL